MIKIKTKKLLITTFTIFLLFNVISFQVQAADFSIEISTPKDGEMVRNTRPTIQANFTGENADITKVTILIDGMDVTEFDEETEITALYVKYTPSEILQLKDGNHTVKITATSKNAKQAEIEWTFIINTTLPPVEEGKIPILLIVQYIVIGVCIGLLIFTIYIIYLSKKKGFTFRKHFAKHPMQKNYLVLYLPIALAFAFVIFGFGYVDSVEGMPPYSYEYILIMGIFVGILPYAVESQLEKRLILKYERGFSQLLFEMADAMRGGLDPTKAIIELASTNSGLLHEPLKKAADSIKLGRPFEEVIQVMARPFKSDLIQRYTTLIAEASKAGGETSIVIHRAAKDMDDFIKVNMNRTRQLTMQTTTVYISFVVMLVTIYLLLTMFPSMEGMDLSLLGSTSLESTSSSGGTGITQLSDVLIRRRFFHVVMINSIGTGLVVGGFVDGKIKMGLIHALTLLAVGVIFFAVMLF